MPDTLENISIPLNDWVDLYALSGLTVGSEVSVQNIGVCDLYIAVQATQPVKKHNAYKIIQRKNGINYKSIPDDSGLWAFCNTDVGLVNIEPFQDGNKERVILPSAARTVTINSPDFVNPNAKGGHFLIDISAVGTDPRILAIIQGKDPISGNYYNILISPKYSVVGTNTIKVYPGLNNVPNICVNDILPRVFRVQVVHTTGVSITYSVSVALSS